MAPKKQTQTTVESAPAPAPAPVPAKSAKSSSAKSDKAATKSSSAKSDKATKSAPAPAPAKVEKAAKAPRAQKTPREESESEATEPKIRRKASKETVDEDMGSLTSRLDEEIERLETKRKTEKNSKVTGVQFLKQLRKAVKILHRDASKVLKIRKTNRPANDHSGFKKPVKVSDEIVKFFGWDSSKLYSRTDVTRAVCKYIRDHNLQDPSNKRIIRPDAKLATLLSYDAKTMPIDKKTGKPSELFYYYLQKLLTRHFPAPVSK